MGLLSHRVERSDIVAGDHIYSWRTSFVYAHHGIYLNESIVVHFTNDDPTIKRKSNDCSSFITCTSSSPSIKCHSTSAITKLQTTCSNSKYCGFRKQNSGVKISCLDCFLGNGSLYLYQYNVPWYYLIAKRGGTCTTAKSDPPEIVFRRAMYLLLDHGFGEFDLMENNCEDFALYCKTGRIRVNIFGKKEGCSGQVSSFASSGIVVHTSAAAGFFLSGPVALATTAAVYSLARCSTDIGSGVHGVEVEVEELAKFLANGKRPVKKN